MWYVWTDSVGSYQYSRDRTSVVDTHTPNRRTRGSKAKLGPTPSEGLASAVVGRVAVG